MSLGASVLTIILGEGAQKWVIVLVGVTDPDHQRLATTQTGWKEYGANPRTHKTRLESTCHWTSRPQVNSSERPQPLHTSRASEGEDPSGTKLWFSSLGKEHQPASVFAGPGSPVCLPVLVPEVSEDCITAFSVFVSPLKVMALTLSTSSLSSP